VRHLIPYRDLNALQTVGYKEFFDFFDGKISKEDAILQLKQHTRQYAKRQMTWFKKDMSYQWAAPSFDDVQSVLKKGFDFILP
jgi:tRNA dimethylallyltransferase